MIDGNKLFLLIIGIGIAGRATITVVNTDDKQAYNLERGDALRLPAGTTSYLLNRDDNQNLRVVKLAIPVNKPGQFDVMLNLISLPIFIVFPTPTNLFFLYRISSHQAPKTNNPTSEASAGIL